MCSRNTELMSWISDLLFLRTVYILPLKTNKYPPQRHIENSKPISLCHHLMNSRKNKLPPSEYIQFLIHLDHIHSYSNSWYSTTQLRPWWLFIPT